MFDFNCEIIFRIIGTVFAWFSIEDEMLRDYGSTVVSAELCCTSLWCAKRFISAIGLNLHRSSWNNRLSQVSAQICQLLVDFALQKSFRIFQLMSEEKKFVIPIII